MKKPRLVAWLYLGLGLAQAAHSVEEVLTGLWKNMPMVTGWMHERFAAIPILQWSAEGFAAANLVIVAIMLGFSPFPFVNFTWSWKIVRVVAVIELLNGLLHLGGIILMRGYWPGCISGGLLVILSIVLLLQKGGRE